MYKLIRNLHLTPVCLMTPTEVATALRPFYFTVHPDLFGQFPTQRLTNENSLKQLSSFMEGIQSKKYPPPCNVEFYIRDKNQKNTFRLVKLSLKEREVRDVVLKLLKTCELSTDFVDKIPKPPPQTPKQAPSPFYDIDMSNMDPNDPIFGPIAIKRKIKETQDTFRLASWIDKNYKDALTKTSVGLAMRDEIHKLKTELIRRCGLKELRYDCGWNETHFIGCLKSFELLSDQHPENMYILRGRVLVFASFTGVSLDGHIMLNSGEVRHNWLDLIKNIRKYDAHLLRIPAFEKSVSQVLREINVVRRKFMPKILAGEYERNLQQITTSLSDYLTYRKFPISWPPSLKNYEIVVETEAGPLMVSPTGQFIVPSSCPGFLLVSFITENMKEALDRIDKYKTNKHVEVSLQKRCISELNLLDLQKDDNVTPDLMIACCEKLLLNKAKLGNLKHVHLNIATYYSVLSDGVVCIPWNWTI